MSSSPALREAVALRPLRPLFHVAREHGIDADAALAAVGIAAELLEQPDARADGARVREALLTVSRQAGDAPLGLFAARHIQEGDFGLLSFLITSAESLRDAAQLAQGFYALLDPSAELRLEEDGRTARAVLAARTRPVVLPIVAEYTLAAAVELTRKATGHDLRADEVRFVHRRDRHRAAFEELFRAPVRFCAERDEVLFARIFLDMRMPKADPALRQTFLEYAQRLLAETESSESFSERARRIVLDDLRTGDSTLDGLAQKLGLGRRTLQRRLQELGTSHQTLVDAVRRELALEYLEHTDWSVSKVASVLGFSDASTFSRAFRRWMDTSPGRFKGGDLTLAQKRGSAADEPS